MTARIALLTSLAVTLLVACDSDFEPGSLVERTRVLGAEVQVVGAPERAAPAPGETAGVRLLMAWPAEEPALGWILLACLEPHGGGMPCESGTLATQSGTGAEPRLEIRVPEGDALGQSTAIRLLGLVCEDGMPESSEPGSGPRCSGDGAQATPLELEIPLAVGDFDNRSPSLADDTLVLDGKRWQADEFDADVKGCAGDATDEPRLRADGETHEITVRFAGDDREEVDGELETLQLSSFTTAGELSTQFSFVESDDTRDEPELELEWDAPAAKDVPKDGLRVRFVWVARDLRGGLSSTTRTLCVTR